MTGALQFFAPHVSAASSAAGWLAFLAGLAVKSTFVLAAAWIAARALSRASAATRHLLWTAAFGSLLALPLLSAALPGWRVTLPATAAQRAVPIAASETATGAVAPHELPGAPAAAASEAKGAMSWPAWILVVWAAGLIFVLGRLALGTARLRGIARRAVKLDPARCDLACRLAQQLGLRRTVAVLESDRVAMPMAAGVVRPLILLPAVASEWPLERLRVVLAHELAHIKRHDCLIQLLGQLACAAYWFHPLAWLASRRLRQEREHASDDLVLGLGTRPADYAGHLVELARALRVLRARPASWSSAAVAMAQPSNLEARVVAVLNPGLNRRPLSLRVGMLTVAALAAVVVPLAALQTSAKRDTAEIWGRVYDPSGAVIPDTTVTITNEDSRITQTVRTEQDGSYKFPDILAGEYDVEVSHFGFGFFRRGLNLERGANLRLDVTLDPGRVSETLEVVAKAPPDVAEQSKARVPHRIRVGGNVEAAKLISQVKPVYPEDLRRKGVQGLVLISAVISPEGNVLSLQVTNEPEAEFAKAATEAVRQWKYQPTTLNGVPVEVVTTITVNFRLEK